METYSSILINSQQPKKSKLNMWLSTVILIVMALITWLLTIFARNNAAVVENLYSSSLYPCIANSMSLFSNIVPFSLAEIFLLFIFLLGCSILALLLFKPKIIFRNKFRIIHWLLRSLAILYILFYFLWGFNYYRMDYMDLANMNKEPATVDDLKELTIEIIHNLNTIRQNLSEDDNGVFAVEESFKELSDQAKRGFENYMVGSFKLDGNLGQAKPILLSKWMSYTGIMGIYFPYTNEPNVNSDIPILNLLSTISHEMAHQRGFAKEDEANFISYKANVNNPDEKFQYAGYYLAMNYLMNDIYKSDQEVYYTLYSLISDAAKVDMKYNKIYWESKEGKTEKVVTNMNDNYLKANNQKQGILSYNGVVKLLISEYKSKSVQ